MYVSWLQFIVSAVILIGAAAAIVVATRRILDLRAEGHPGGAWSALRVLGILLALVAVFLIWRATALGGAHESLDENTVDDLGRAYFNEHYYAHGTVNKDGFDEWQRFVDPDYDLAKASVDNRDNGSYCIRVTRQHGGQYGEDGHHTGYHPKGVEKKTICIPIVWNGDTEKFEATESEPTE
jgi:hypothetical protein